jgi:hypothetical protein
MLAQLLSVGLPLGIRWYIITPSRWLYSGLIVASIGSTSLPGDKMCNCPHAHLIIYECA